MVVTIRSEEPVRPTPSGRQPGTIVANNKRKNSAGTAGSRSSGGGSNYGKKAFSGKHSSATTCNGDDTSIESSHTLKNNSTAPTFISVERPTKRSTYESQLMDSGIYQSGAVQKEVFCARVRNILFQKVKFITNPQMLLFGHKVRYSPPVYKKSAKKNESLTHPPNFTRYPM
jgi:hypothetical protein